MKARATHDGSALRRELERILEPSRVLTGDDTAPYLHDATESQGISGWADAAVLPVGPDEVAAAVRWCYEHDVPVTPRGGGTGFAGGCVPAGGVVVALAGLAAVRALDPLLWRMQVGAGATTRTVQRLARESGLAFPPDPGAPDQSQIGGNVATNAGGPHTFKYGTTAAWVTGLEAVVAPGELVTVGGPVRKDVAGYDLVRLLCGSEGTLGIVTGVWLRLIPAIEASLPLIASYPDVAAGCAALEAAMASGAVPAAIEYLDADCMAVAGGGLAAALGMDIASVRGGGAAATGASATSGAAAGGRATGASATGDGAAMVLVVEADGSEREATAARDALREALAPGSLAVEAPDAAGARALWRWREGVSDLVAGERGGKLSEDIVVPLDRLAEAIEGTRAVGERHGLRACSWGHAGDGNLHSTLMVDPRDGADLERAHAAAQDLFALAARLGGSVSGEHGLGLAKSGQLERQWAPAALDLHEAVKRAFDPKGLLNPGKKRARA